MKTAWKSSMARGLLLVSAATLSQAAVAASLTFNNLSNPDEVAISAGQFESGFSVNGTQIQAPGLGSGSTTVLETDNACVITYSGSWIDLGRAALGTRTIYFVNPTDNSVVTDILFVDVSDGGSGAIISGTWTSNACGDLGAVPVDTPAGDIVPADGTVVGFSNAFLGARAYADTVLDLDGSVLINVTKTFSNGDTGEVEVTLTCNGGIPLEQSFMLSADDAAGVTFTVNSLPADGADCAVTESGGMDGYTTVMNGGAGCSWTGIVDRYRSCAIENVAQPTAITVETNVMIDDPNIDTTFTTTVTCDNVSPNSGPDDFGTYSDTDTTGLFDADWYAEPGQTANCTAEMVPNDMAIEGAECAFSFVLGDDEAGCKLVGTVFFEGIPTLSQYGVALMALLMLGVGFVGMRRFV